MYLTWFSSVNIFSIVPWSQYTQRAFALSACWSLYRHCCLMHWNVHRTVPAHLTGLCRACVGSRQRSSFSWSAGTARPTCAARLRLWNYLPSEAGSFSNATTMWPTAISSLSTIGLLESLTTALTTRIITLCRQTRRGLLISLHTSTMLWPTRWIRHRQARCDDVISREPQPRYLFTGTTVQ